jgi:hypothetical protein
VPLLLRAPPDGHDRGIAHDPTGFTKVFDLYPDHRFMGLDEYIGYQHADIQTPPEEDEVKLAVNYDPHYCRALIAKGSTWDLHLSDWLRAKLRTQEILVDGKKAGAVQQEVTTISLAPGSQTHTIELH